MSVRVLLLLAIASATANADVAVAAAEGPRWLIGTLDAQADFECRDGQPKFGPPHAEVGFVRLVGEKAPAKAMEVVVTGRPATGAVQKARLCRPLGQPDWLEGLGGFRVLSPRTGLLATVGAWQPESVTRAEVLSVRAIAGKLVATLENPLPIKLKVGLVAEYESCGREQRPVLRLPARELGAGDKVQIGLQVGHVDELDGGRYRLRTLRLVTDDPRVVFDHLLAVGPVGFAGACP